MKKQINGSLYNTDTAKMLGNVHNTQPDHSPGHVYEALYRTKAGKYFVYAKGGADTKYATMQLYGNWTMGEVIIPLSREKAEEWARANLPESLYNTLFAYPSDNDDEIVTLCISVPAGMKKKLHIMSENAGVSVTDIIYNMLVQAL